MTAMIDAKGEEYVRAWPLRIARQTGTITITVFKAVNDVTGINCVPAGTLHEDEDLALATIGALTPDQAKTVIERVRAAALAENPHGRPRCHFCGLPVGRDGECEECV